MYIDLELQSRLQPFVHFDWRLLAERGLRCYGHFHRLNKESKTVATCEIGFLKKMSIEEAPVDAAAAAFEQHPAARSLLIGGTSATRRAAQFKCVGAIRKAGFLSVKKWILKRRSSIELARKQGWKRYWVCLRGTALLFHSVLDSKTTSGNQMTKQENANSDNNRIDLLSWIRANCSDRAQMQLLANMVGADQNTATNIADIKQQQESKGDNDNNDNNNADCLQGLANMAKCYIEREPRHLIIIEGAISQPIPEHPKRDFVFCLSTTFGDAYLFQASCQLESDNWISAIHNACAASIARDLTRDEATKLFETKIRRLELEAEKKLFLRQRLESRLTSMSSMSHISLIDPTNTMDAFAGLSQSVQSAVDQQQRDSQAKKVTMRSLLHRLQQQLLALDTYIEQIHCEVYQLRCYLCSCTTQKLFYQSLLIGSLAGRQTTTGAKSSSRTGAAAESSNTATTALFTIDLPHPKSLLMHVSKPTKLLLIKLGVFTVSSFHAYIHARQGSAETILHKIQQQQMPPAQLQQQQAESSATSEAFELRVRSHSISELLLNKSSSNETAQAAEFERNTEQLIEMSNLKLISIKLARKLFCSIRGQQQQEQEHGSELSARTTTLTTTARALNGTNNCDISSSDDRYSIHEDENQVLVNLKVHSNSLPMSIIKQLLIILNPNLSELEFLNYYLRFNVSSSTTTTTTDAASGTTNLSGTQVAAPQIGNQGNEATITAVGDLEQQPRASATSSSSCAQYVAKRRETLSDWANYDQLELMEKIVYSLELQRCRTDEESAIPFGISIGAQLFSSKSKSLLNVYCSYIEWGSVADKASLKDDDEFLIINGVPVMDLDMMFVECILQEANKLKLVVRSSRSDCPPNATLLDRSSSNWSDSSGKGGGGGEGGGGIANSEAQDGSHQAVSGSLGAPGGRATSQLISDEYISSLVCPPPPVQSSAFLRAPEAIGGGVFLRQKSDLRGSKTEALVDDDEDDEMRPVSSSANLYSKDKVVKLRSRAKSQLNLDTYLYVDNNHRGQEGSSNKQEQEQEEEAEEEEEESTALVGSALNPIELANQLLKKTEQLTRLLAGKSPVDSWNRLGGSERSLPQANLNDDALPSDNVSKKPHQETTFGMTKQFNTSNEADQSAAHIVSSKAAVESSRDRLLHEELLSSSPAAAAAVTSASDHSVERLKKSMLELLETECAYVRHLETICDHYMGPLEDVDFLNIPNLKHLRRTINELVKFQRDFFSNLTKAIATTGGSSMQPKTLADSSSDQMGATNSNQDESSDELNRIIQQLDLFKTIEQFIPSLLALCGTFMDEADRFKVYAAYCAAYSRFQKLLHPTRLRSSSSASGASNMGPVSTTIVSFPNSLDVFVGSSHGIGGALMTVATGGGSHAQSHREFLRPLSSFINNQSSANSSSNSHTQLLSSGGGVNLELSANQLKQLGEFLGNLDSSSSSASLSLPKSSTSGLNSPAAAEVANQQQQQQQKNNQQQTTIAKQQQGCQLQKSVHQQNFESYLIKPIQRIVKYPMLLNSIAISAQIICTNNETLPTNEIEPIKSVCNELQLTVKRMESITSHVNDAQRVHDEYGSVFDNIERQYFDQQQLVAAQQAAGVPALPLGGPHQPTIGLNIEQLLYFGSVNWLNIAEFTSKLKKGSSGNLSQLLFVFTSCVVFICKEQLHSRTIGGNKRNRSSITSGAASNSNQALTTGVQSGSTSGLANNSLSGKAYHKSLGMLDQCQEVIRYQTLIPVSEVQVRSVPVSSSDQSETKSKPTVSSPAYRWELFRCSSVNSNSSLLSTKSTAPGGAKRSSGGKVYLLANSSNDERNAFLRKIRFIIRESVRNMSLPLARSPSSKSLTPKKLSSPSSVCTSTTNNSSCSHSTSLSPVCNGEGHHCCKKGISAVAASNPSNRNNDNSNYAEKFQNASHEPVVCDNNQFKTGIKVNN